MHENPFPVLPIHEDSGGRVDGHMLVVGKKGDDEPIWFLSVKATARALGGITTRQVYNLLRKGEMESALIGRRRMVYAVTVEAYAARLRRAGAESAA